MKSASLLYSKKNTWRANHHHKSDWHFIYVLEGTFEYYFRKTDSKDKIIELKGYVSANEKILATYKDQFEGGIRTFVDVLDIESDLYNSHTQLIDEEIKLV